MLSPNKSKYIGIGYWPKCKKISAKSNIVHPYIKEYMNAKRKVQSEESSRRVFQWRVFAFSSPPPKWKLCYSPKCLSILRQNTISKAKKHFLKLILIFLLSAEQKRRKLDTHSSPSHSSAVKVSMAWGELCTSFLLSLPVGDHVFSKPSSSLRGTHWSLRGGLWSQAL